MSYTSVINTKLNASTTLKAKFPNIGFLVLPPDNKSNYVSFRKLSSSFNSTLDNSLSEECGYEITLYAAKFADLESMESEVVGMFQGQYLKDALLGRGGMGSIVSIMDDLDTVLSMYKKTFSLVIK